MRQRSSAVSTTGTCGNNTRTRQITVTDTRMGYLSGGKVADQPVDHGASISRERYAAIFRNPAPTDIRDHIQQQAELRG